MSTAKHPGIMTPEFSNLTPADVSRAADICAWAQRAGDEYMGAWFRRVVGAVFRKITR